MSAHDLAPLRRRLRPVRALDLPGAHSRHARLARLQLGVVRPEPRAPDVLAGPRLCAGDGHPRRRLRHQSGGRHRLHQPRVARRGDRRERPLARAPPGAEGALRAEEPRTPPPADRGGRAPGPRLRPHHLHGCPPPPRRPRARHGGAGRAPPARGRRRHHALRALRPPRRRDAARRDRL